MKPISTDGEYKSNILEWLRIGSSSVKIDFQVNIYG
jgi:hypothetical protein